MFDNGSARVGVYGETSGEDIIDRRNGRLLTQLKQADVILGWMHT